MAKPFAKGKPATAPAAATKTAPAAAVKKTAPPPPVEEVEEPIAEATEAGAEAAAEGNGEDKPRKGGSNAPRARKWNYGPIGPKSQAKILKVKDATAPKGIAAHADQIKGGMTVEALYALGIPDVRHVLRVAMRGKFIVVKEGDTQYPVAYDHAAAQEAREAKAAAAAAKKAAEAEAAGEEEVAA